MNGLPQRLSESGAIKAFEQIGLDARKLFDGLEACKMDPYRNHMWVVMDSSTFLVVNAIPEEGDQDHLFWEEWYLQKEVGEIHHHILTLFEPASYDEIFQAPEQDDIHPPQCFSKRWYVVEDLNMNALLARR